MKSGYASIGREIEKYRWRVRNFKLESHDLMFTEQYTHMK
jgi:hypothetical protein